MFFLRLGVFAFLLSVLQAHAASDCVVCHAKIAETYARTGMGRSFYRPTKDLPASALCYHQPSETWFEMAQRDGALYQRR